MFIRIAIKRLLVYSKYIGIKLYSIYCQIVLKSLLFLYNVPHGKIKTGGGVPRLILGQSSLLKIGNNVNFANHWEVGWYAKCFIRIQGNGVLSIGDNVGINSTGIFCNDEITIGNNVYIGGGTQIFDTNFHNTDYIARRDVVLNNESKTAPVVIEDDVFIGSSCIITKGVTIGSRSLVSAGSVVISSIPSDELWGGNPAIFIKKINT